VADKRIPYLKVGHFIRFDPEEIATWLNALRVGVGGSSIVRDECAEPSPALVLNESMGAASPAPLRHSRRRSRGKEPSSPGTLW
jgi:hypothetical protein